MLKDLSNAPLEFMAGSSPENDKNYNGQDDQDDQQRQPEDLAVRERVGLDQGIAVYDFVGAINQLRLGTSDLAEQVALEGQLQLGVIVEGMEDGAGRIGIELQGQLSGILQI
jgi:hypothetical protein